MIVDQIIEENFPEAPEHFVQSIKPFIQKRYHQLVNYKHFQKRLTTFLHIRLGNLFGDNVKILQYKPLYPPYFDKKNRLVFYPYDIIATYEIDGIRCKMNFDISNLYSFEKNRKKKIASADTQPDSDSEDDNKMMIVSETATSTITLPGQSIFHKALQEKQLWNDLCNGLKVNSLKNCVQQSYADESGTQIMEPDLQMLYRMDQFNGSYFTQMKTKEKQQSICPDNAFNNPSRTEEPDVEILEEKPIPPSERNFAKSHEMMMVEPPVNNDVPLTQSEEVPPPLIGLFMSQKIPVIAKDSNKGLFAYTKKDSVFSFNDSHGSFNSNNNVISNPVLGPNSPEV